MSLATPELIRRLQEKLYEKAKKEPTYRFYLLYDKVYRLDILRHAYAVSRSAGGAPGVDGVRFTDIETQGLEEWLARLGKELREKTYRPAPVRRVMIPKSNGGERPLGIPTIRDRVVQTAAKLVLEPIFEADFLPEAYGYRPGCRAQDAVKEVHEALCSGYTDVVDADLSKYFDTIPHSELMQSVARRVSDRHMLALVKGWLKAPVSTRGAGGRDSMDGGKGNGRGTPQGGVISPLLANIYMHRYLRAWRQHGKGDQYQARVVNYADDFVILSRSHAAEALAWTRRVLTRIGLTLNETKTCVRDARRESFNFLGYAFGPEHYRKDGHWYLAAQPAPKSVSRIKDRVRQVLHRGNTEPWPKVAARLTRILRGWAAYFSYGTRYLAYRAVEQYLLDRVRYFLRRRHKVSSRGTRRFNRRTVFGDLGLSWLRTLGAAPSCAPS